MEISASQVKELREKTGLGMMICKEALIKANGDMNLAIEDLRKQGQATAAKRADRAAKEGKVSIVTGGDAAMVYEVNAETDFVAKNEDFVAFIDNLGKILTAQKPADHAAAMQLSDPSIGSITVEAKVTELIGKIGEKIQFRRYKKMVADPSKEKFFSYIHGAGKIGVLIKFSASTPAALASAELAELGKDLAMQVAAARPSAVDASSIPADVIAKEKEIYAAQAKESGKPEAVWEKIIDGKLQKYYEEFTLVNQTSIRYEKSVKEMIAEVSKAVGAEIKPVEFFRFELGESD
ncbi:MAG: translation elongation factor Ts [Chitinispirillia bacterium]|nr:translation elongation factor Ts [Chitinispirillia bacterium]MCL2268120.1 translation elongation factor Ts [Chitinispirillia bacterium]